MLKISTFNVNEMNESSLHSKLFSNQESPDTTWVFPMARSSGRMLNERSEERTVNGKRVGFSFTNERETGQEMSIDERERFGTAGSSERGIKREIVSNLQPSKQ